MVGSAYTNNLDNFPTAPDLFSIDSNSNNLYRHSTDAGDAAGSFNQLNLVRSPGITAGTSVGFDIGQDGVAYLSSANNLYTVNLTSGSATLLGPVGGSGLVSIAALAVPEASTAGVLMLTGLCALRRRRA